MKIVREKVDSNNEFVILGHMVMDDSVCSAVYLRYKSGDIRTGHFTKEYKNIFRWIIRYYARFNKAPKKSIKTIYEHKKKNLGKEQRELTEAYLDRIAEEYAQGQEDAIDPQFVWSVILPDFMRERELAYRIEKAQEKLEKGLVQEAEEVFTEYDPVIQELEDENLGIIMPLTRDDLKSADAEEAFNEEDIVFKFEGNQEAIKYIVGDLRRGWLVAVTGIEKAGKSFVMEELGYTASVYQEKKVLKINLELSQTLQRERLWKRISGSTDPWQMGDNIYPIFDCENNQYGTCKRKEMRKVMRKKQPLFEKPGDIVEYESHQNWSACDFCRFKKIRKNQRDTKKFIPTIFFDHSVLKEVSKKMVRRAMRKHERFANLENYRVKCFPRFSVTFDEVRTYIMRYIEKTHWHPDIIILDYIDIMAQEHPEIRIDIDNKWKKASKLAGELNCLVLNADQANKASRTAYAIDKTSTSESKTKDGHLDVRFAINQMPYEKDLNIARMNCLFHRHLDFNEQREVMITQRLEVSQPILDSVRILEREKKFKVVNKKYI